MIKADSKGNQLMLQLIDIVLKTEGIKALKITQEVLSQYEAIKDEAPIDQKESDTSKMKISK